MALFLKGTGPGEILGVDSGYRAEESAYVHFVTLRL